MMGKPPRERPDFFNREALEAWLEQQHPSAGVSTILSELYLVVPLLVRNLTDDEFLQAVKGYEEEFKMSRALDVESFRYLRRWATELLESYRQIRESKHRRAEETE